MGLSTLAALNGRWASAARLAGASTAVHERIGAPPWESVTAMHERALSAAREALGEAIRCHIEEGRQLSAEDAAHLWRVGGRGGEPRALTSAPGRVSQTSVEGQGVIGYVHADAPRRRWPTWAFYRLRCDHSFLIWPRSLTAVHNTNDTPVGPDAAPRDISILFSPVRGLSLGLRRASLASPASPSCTGVIAGPVGPAISRRSAWTGATCGRSGRAARVHQPGGHQGGHDGGAGEGDPGGDGGDPADRRPGVARKQQARRVSPRNSERAGP